MKISIIGAGIYSIALAQNIKNEYNVVMWSESKDIIEHFKIYHDFAKITNAKILDNINVSSSLEETIKDTNIIIIGVASQYVSDICVKLADYYRKNTPIIIASKGLDFKKPAFFSDVVKKCINTETIGIISGPTFAVDLIDRDFCALTLASTDEKTIKITKEVFNNDNLKIRVNDDIYGTQVCGSIKNVMAIASGIIDGLGYKDSTRAFFLTEVVHDIKKLLKTVGYDENTMLSYAGIGDLILTCSSPKSRNYTYGVMLGERKKKEEIDSYINNNTVEGYLTLLSFRKIIKKKKLNFPIIEIIYNIAVNEKKPTTLVEFLLNKE